MRGRHARRMPPGRISYVDGQYLPHRRAGVHIEDRGFLFGDAVYEVCRIENGEMYDLKPHLDRLEHSLSLLSIPMPMARTALSFVMGEVVRRNRVTYGLVYLEVSRGVARRSFPFPAPSLKPTLVVMAHATDPAEVASRMKNGISVVTRPDIRWGRCDIKTVQLLAAAEAKTEAREAGASEVWLVDEKGFVTEGGSSNVWIVTGAGQIVTRDLSRGLLPGVTRKVALQAAVECGLNVEERSFSVTEARSAVEAFDTSSTGPVIPVIAIDGVKIGRGVPGPITQKLQEIYARASYGCLS